MASIEPADSGNPDFPNRKISPNVAREWIAAFQAGGLRLLNYLDGNRREEMKRDIRSGLTRNRKAIPSKYFYDAAGSRLFEEICRLPEYYPTRTEISILERAAGPVMEFFFDEGGDLIELGSGSNRKTRMLLDALPKRVRERVRYVPVDISIDSLFLSASELIAQYPDLEILAIAADFTRHLGRLPRRRKLITFFGSTLGNLAEAETLFLMGRLRRIMNPGDVFLLGLDMVKPVEILETAYNDRRGVTAQFNRNILRRINRELRGDFPADEFEHVAFFSPGKDQVEMHLGARRDMHVRVEDLDLSIFLSKGETIHTEICRKFTRGSAWRLFRRCRFTPARWFTDPREWFSLVELKVEEDAKPVAEEERRDV